MQLLLLFSILSSVVLASTIWPSNNTSSRQAGHSLLKRWYGVPPLADGEKPVFPFYYPWPTTCTNPYTQPLRYCFADKRSAKNLQSIVNEAVALWSPALDVTALKIELDPRAGGDPNFLCSDMEGDKDALVITDMTKDGDKDWNRGGCATVTTVGYEYPAEGEISKPYRHYLNFCQRDPDDPDGTHDSSVRVMTHELGHAIGLSHEHQRPDRGDHLWFRCKYLAGYDEAKTLVMEDEDEKFGNPYDEDEDPDEYEDWKPMTLDQRMRDVCTDSLTAESYLPNALAFLRGDQFTVGPDKEKYESYKYSDQFDFESVMIYDSDAGRSSEADRKNKYVITRKSNDKPVWMGGSETLENFRISKGDIARVAQLYDAHTEACTAAQNGADWGPIKVKIRDDFEKVIWPRKRDEL